MIAWLADPSARTAWRRALFLSPESQEARTGMREASLAHFELALQMRNWRQAREKLEQAREEGQVPRSRELNTFALLGAAAAQETPPDPILIEIGDQV